MIASIVVAEYPYEGNWQVDSEACSGSGPSEVWLSKRDAQRWASKHLSYDGDVWEIELPDEWLKKATLRLSEECGTLPS